MNRISQEKMDKLFLKIFHDSWRPLIPKLDSYMLNILKYLVERGEATLYRISRDLDISFSLGYKKGSILKNMKFIVPYNRSMYRPSIKSYISLYINNEIPYYTLLKGVKEIYKLNDMDEYSIMSFLYLLSLVLNERGLDLAKATICNIDEASLHVIRLYLRCVFESLISGEYIDYIFKDHAKKIGISSDMLLGGFRIAIKGILNLIPPTIVTKNHRTIFVLREGKPHILMTECKDECRYYRENLGLTCPYLLKEIYENMNIK